MVATINLHLLRFGVMTVRPLGLYIKPETRGFFSVGRFWALGAGVWDLTTGVQEP